MGKVKNLEKKTKVATEFDKNSPDDRVKSIKKEKIPKKSQLTKKSDGITKAKKSVEIQKIKKKKKVKILTQIKQEVETIAKKIETKGISEDSEKLVPREIVKKALIAVKDGIKKEAENNATKKSNLFDDELRIGLLVILTKVPNCPPHAKRLVLSHSLFEEEPDICFFIRDSVPKKADQEENVRNFKQKLDDAGVNCKKIMTVTQLKQDYQTHNLKMKLCNLYDIFLVENEIAEHVYALLGKHFISKRKRPIQIDTKKTSLLKELVEKAKKKVSFKLSGNSNSTCIDVGTVKMDNVKIADNVMVVIDELKEKLPGSWNNISRLFLKPMRQSKVSIPIFYSSINPNDVSVPVIKSSKVNRLEKLANKLKNKAKRLKLDIKNKQIVKGKAEKMPAAGKKTDEKKSKVETEENTTEPPKKKSKKALESSDVMPTTSEPKKKKKKNAKEKAAIAEDILSVDEPEKEKKRKNKKKNNDVKLESNDAQATEVISESVEQHELEKKNKKKKKKSKAVDVVTDTINDENTTVASEKEQIPKKKKKDKKNKA